MVSNSVNRTVLFFTAVSLLLFQNFQCGNCRYTDCAEPVFFRVFDDKSGENIFFGTGASYHPDSAYISDKFSWKSGNRGTQSWGWTNDSLMHMYQWTLSDTFYFSFQGDVDTILCRYRYENTECCKPYHHIRQVEYNSNPGVNNSGVWEFRKK